MAVILGLLQGTQTRSFLTTNAQSPAAQINAGEAIDRVTIAVAARRRYDAATVPVDGLQRVGVSPEPAVLIIGKITVDVR